MPTGLDVFYALCYLLQIRFGSSFGSVLVLNELDYSWRQQTEENGVVDYGCDEAGDTCYNCRHNWGIVEYGNPEVLECLAHQCQYDRRNG